MKKHKIGIITYHNAINYGAVLQSYALNKYINSQNHNCEIIDYKCDKILLNYKLLNFRNKSFKSIINSILNIPCNIVKGIKFKKFINKNIVVSDKKYNSKNIDSSNDVYDVFITGSDQVWNLELNNDYNYFLKFVNRKNKKNSYAASFGNIDVLEKNVIEIKKLLSLYDNISVREQSTIKKLKDRCNLDSVHVLDPTFLISKNEWCKLISNKNNSENYILLYVLHEESAYLVAQKLSKLTGLKVYIITESRRKRIKGKYFRKSGPVDFITLIKNSSYVVTDSFHGTALSIIFNKNLKVVLKKKMQYFNERLISIINTLGLEECIVDMKSSDDKLIRKVNYKKIEPILKDNIIHSQKYINRIIMGIEEK